MSYLFTQPQLLSEAATNLAGIGSSVSAANAAAVLPTTGVMAAGADEISSAMATIFGSHAQQYQAMGQQAAKLHSQFVQAMSAASGAYADAEAVNAAPLQPVQQASSSAAAAPAGGLLGGPVSPGVTGAGGRPTSRPVGLLPGNGAGARPVTPGRVGGSGLTAGNARLLAAPGAGAAGGTGRVNSQRTQPVGRGTGVLPEAGRTSGTGGAAGGGKHRSAEKTTAMGGNGGQWVARGAGSVG